MHTVVASRRDGVGRQERKDNLLAARSLLLTALCCAWQAHLAVVDVV